MIDVVVVYDRSGARVLEEIVYIDDPVTAFTVRLDRERAHREQSHVEVVLVSARNMDDLKISHARYFDPQSIRADRLKDISEELVRRAAS
ncbi:MAG: hypothetical protein QOJ39_3623 [Candidatus Eremiobacteraeota bacterium]|jgi:hypothetical protein|nr:hypothetical protein [Candidatus Eremiobacteraeota bacterium]